MSEAIESILEPDLPIIDAHHHLWVRTPAELAELDRAQDLMSRTLAPTFHRHARYLLDEYLADIGTGHNIRATVFVQVHTMYRKSGPEKMRSVGEVEFANGVAAMAASGAFGDTAVCAGIVGNVDLRLGDAAREVMEAQQQAGGMRYRGIRTTTTYDDDPTIVGNFGSAPRLVLDSQFRAAFRHLEPLGLSYDAYLLEYQLADLIDLARAFPLTQIIVNHVGGLFGLGRYSGRTAERFARWRDNLDSLARCPNVTVKLGGLGMPVCGFRASVAAVPADSRQLAGEWRPYIETCIELFGANRCMFESNFPVDAATTTYPVLWNAFKRIVSGASSEEKNALFSGTAKRVYRIELE
jgi:L-fuconolactonase